MAANCVTTIQSYMCTSIFRWQAGRQACRQMQHCRMGSQPQAAAHQSGDESDDYGSQTDTQGEPTRLTRGEALVTPDPIPGTSGVNTGSS